MTISKEERAELRKLLADDNGPAAEQLIAAADAAPRILDALDASDERIASLEAELAAWEEFAKKVNFDLYYCATCEQLHDGCFPPSPNCRRDGGTK
jgi:hypothetical protein